MRIEMQQRLTRARAAITAYDPEDLETSIADLLADLGHFCDAAGLDFTALAQTGINHWAAEQIDALDSMDFDAGKAQVQDGAA